MLDGTSAGDAPSHPIVSPLLQMICNRDIAAAMDLMADDVVYVCNMSDADDRYDPPADAFPATTSGRDAVGALLHGIGATLEYTWLRPEDIHAIVDTSTSTRVEIVRCKVTFGLRARRTGYELNGNGRLIVLIRDGLIVHIHDRRDFDMLAAYVGMYG